MSNQVKGIVQKFYDNGTQDGKWGVQYKVAIEVAGTKYSAFLAKPAATLGLAVGKQVEFAYTENGQYKNMDAKSLKISEAPAQQAAPAQRASAPAAANNQQAGIKVGHAINNAVQLACAKGDTSLLTIHSLAADILALSVKLESQYGQIVGHAEERYQARVTANPTPAEQPAPEPAAAAPVKAKATRKTAAKATPQPEPTPAPEPQPEPQPEPAQQDEWVDDIPF